MDTKFTRCSFVGARVITKAKHKSLYLIQQPSGSKYTHDGFNSRWYEAKLSAQAKYPHLSIDFTFHDLKAKGISYLEGTLKRNKQFPAIKTRDKRLFMAGK
ncbi:site-specific integrase [Enterobacter cloacae]|jgi:hypothetical protein|uniref:hypothetical protein n=1 Tax=Enterobacter cloacae TaxID=550 RepID=UPI001D05CBCA|nr:hypothetical protein [Enterobacter cloacae]MCK7265799.1 hypothetical protein [Enterobacter cloacae]MCL8316909.1 hypothetical protein [Enterobacter cloacae subsp. cloacae]MDX7665717.1 hypothetical protein [Enterobacter cloacae]